MLNCFVTLSSNLTQNTHCLLYYILHVQLIPIDYYRLVWIGV